MRRAALLLALAALAGCGREQAAPPAADAAPATTASGVGSVIGVDPRNGTLTLQHGPMPEIGWPAMRMAFKAPPEAIAAAKVGDRVAFDLKLGAGGAEITSLRKL